MYHVLNPTRRSLSGEGRERLKSATAMIATAAVRRAWEDKILRIRPLRIVAPASMVNRPKVSKTNVLSVIRYYKVSESL